MSDKTATNPITSIMHRHIVTTDVSATAKECADRISQVRIGYLIIINKHEPAGIITERSFVHLLKKEHINSKKIKAKDFMSAPLIAIQADADFCKII